MYSLAEKKPKTLASSSVAVVNVYIEITWSSANNWMHPLSHYKEDAHGSHINYSVGSYHHDGLGSFAATSILQHTLSHLFPYNASRHECTLKQTSTRVRDQGGQ